MSQPFRRVLAAVGVTAALLLAAAAPSQAAGHGKPIERTISPAGSPDVLAQAWSWLASFLPAPAPCAIQRKTTYTGTIIVSPPPAPPTGGQGGMIDPEGRP